MKYPIQSFSWEVLSPRVAVKRLDKSAFLHHGSGIPKEIAFFFGLSSIKLKEPKAITLICSGIRFPAYFQMDINHSRYRLFWKADFSRRIQKKFPDFHHAFAQGNKISDDAPLMRFEIQGDGEYLVELILSDIITSDIGTDLQDDSAPRPEGQVKEYYGKRYERDPRNRRLAIAYHGLRCQACGINFEEVYGTRGEGFIEIHHNKPLAVTGKQQPINPKTDMMPLCANCHRMIHRWRDDILSVDELRKQIQSQQSVTEYTTQSASYSEP